MKKALILLALLGGGYYFYTKSKQTAGVTGDPNTMRELTDAEAANYLSQNVDLQQAYGSDITKAKEHWTNWGFSEFQQGKRQSPYLA